MAEPMKQKRFAGLTHREFLSRHWQKTPLLARGALREWSDLLERGDIFELACSEDLESRIVRRTRGRWEVSHGPFSRRELERMPRARWTLLVHGVDRAIERAARLAREFAFIPYARFDDIMVSYAAPGGGVGPHFDSYDVILLQGTGERRWRIGAQRDLTLLAGAPLRILERFLPDEEYTLEAGDVLYLPPRYAHDGVALDECITYSIGFRSPHAQELGTRFLEYLQDRLVLRGQYSDPDLEPVQRPARIPEEMVARFSAMFDEVSWKKSDILDFIGRHLTEPKPHVVYAPPVRPLTARAFERSVRRRGVHLVLQTRMLFHGMRVFINGEACRAGANAARVLARLADAGELAPSRLDAEALALLYEWYRAGYVALGTRG
jgi:50S ribosomal protein L16 3-hydroxylase